MKFYDYSCAWLYWHIFNSFWFSQLFQIWKIQRNKEVTQDDTRWNVWCYCCVFVISSILPLPPAISTSSLQTMREVIGQGDLLQHSDLHQVSVKSFHLITIPPLEAIHPWLDSQPYFRIKYSMDQIMKRQFYTWVLINIIWQRGQHRWGRSLVSTVRFIIAAEGAYICISGSFNWNFIYFLRSEISWYLLAHGRQTNRHQWLQC